ncbi:MAG: flagellar protein FlgN [Bdellovibrionaceae bacterium]|nr:flagellar protein FlgN [Pseudobdellovibrionaceae bacterium]MDW8190655.1 flagellar protein FlgN [Pseudobdellovibrionaceae bacterium]
MDEIRKQKMEDACWRLISNLEEILSRYRQLLDLVRKEKEALQHFDISTIQSINEKKEDLLTKIRFLDSTRERYATELADLVGLDSEYPRLMELAKRVPGYLADKLRLSHATLEIVLKRVQQQNEENRLLVEAGLQTLQGAIADLKSSVTGSSVYRRDKKMDSGKDVAGALRSTQV